MQKAEEWQVSLRDMELWNYLANHSVKQAATYFNEKRKEKWEDPQGAIRAWIYRARIRIERCQRHLNKVYALSKRSARVRKLTIRGAVESEEDEDL